MKFCPKGASRYFWISLGPLIVHPMLISQCGVTRRARGMMIDLDIFNLAPEVVSNNFRIFCNLRKLCSMARMKIPMSYAKELMAYSEVVSNFNPIKFFDSQFSL